MNQVDEVYLDNNASTQPLDAVVESVASTMRELFGNPSSAHSRGSVARHKLIEARETVASFLGAKADQIIFTSGGTEGNNTVLFGVLRSGVANSLVTTRTLRVRSLLLLFSPGLHDIRFTHPDL